MENRKRVTKPKLLNEEDEIGLILFYLNSTMTLNQLCLIFGTTPTSASRIIESMLHIMIPKLKKHPWSRIKFPISALEKQVLADMVHNREPSVDDVIDLPTVYQYLFNARPML